MNEQEQRHNHDAALKATGAYASDAASHRSTDAEQLRRLKVLHTITTSIAE
jgi:hypothetical protein